MTDINGDKIPTKKCYVSMTDKFLSGWGMAQGKTNKLVIGVNDFDLCMKIKKNAKERSEMKYVNMSTRKPSFNKRRVLVSYKDSSELGEIWTK